MNHKPSSQHLNPLSLNCKCCFCNSRNSQISQKPQGSKYPSIEGIYLQVRISMKPDVPIFEYFGP